MLTWPKLNDWIKPAALVLVIFTALAIPLGLQIADSGLPDGTRLSLSQALNMALVDYWMRAVPAIVVVFCIPRFRFTRDKWRVSLAAHLGGYLFYCVAFALIRALVLPTSNPIYMPGDRPLKLALQVFRQSIASSLWIYLLIVATTHAILLYRENRQRQMGAIQLQAQLSRAQLDLLKAQLHPHFTFNTLHAISTLMARDVPGARLMLVRLGDLLRMAMERFDAQELTLKEELEFVSNYLEIERIRFQDRLSVEMDVTPDVLDAMVPALLLQPLVENAVRHGISAQPQPGVISICCRQDDGDLKMVISDNGPGMPANPNPRNGIGIANTRARLQQLYGDRFAFEFSSPRGSGLDVTIRIPIHFDPLARPSDTVELHQIA